VTARLTGQPPVDWRRFRYQANDDSGSYDRASFATQLLAYPGDVALIFTGMKDPEVTTQSPPDGTWTEQQDAPYTFGYIAAGLQSKAISGAAQITAAVPFANPTSGGYVDAFGSFLIDIQAAPAASLYRPAAWPRGLARGQT
jgi:hypothetical protein